MANIDTKQPGLPSRICLGMGAPDGLSEFLAQAGLEILPFAQKHFASLYVDFVGARPTGVPLLSIEIESKSGRGSRAEADFSTNNWESAACFILSHVLKLQPPLLTADSEMLAMMRTAVCVAPSSVSVIITGEIGSGKQALARLIHSASRRRGAFAVVNCAALDSSSDGADPSAISPYGGSIAQFAIPAGTVDGTLFLDEVGELTMPAQVKLLTMLQGSEARLVEGDASVAVRPIAATNRSLSEMVGRGEFRRDLFWRLNVFSVELPPLRRRAGDIPILSRYFLRQANPRRSLSPFALKMLGNYPFPGNIRELQNLIARLAIAPLAGGGHLVDSADIRRHLLIQGAEAEPPTSGWKTSREEARRDMVLRAIAASGGNRIDAARKLGITPRTLQYHITKAGLSRPRNSKTIESGAISTSAAM
ncbi:MAG: sigma 54-interacting transcriptional regulator [Candidatus Binataceae bacterium]|jgi:transcriptional regulator with PAS, ATPase and Fis domain